MKKSLRTAAVITAALITTGNTDNAGNWSATVTDNGRGHEIGNPEADVKLTEFVSYTCSHCATFTRQGEAPLQLAYIGTGKLKLEIRSVIRNPIDTVATIVVQCGSTDKFFRNHAYFMTSQSKWIATFDRPTQAQIQRWTGPNGAKARKALAEDAGFYKMMETRGYSRTELDTCLNDDAKAQQLTDNSNADYTEFGVNSTPSFAINGERLDRVHNWSSLEPKLNESFEKF